MRVSIAASIVIVTLAYCATTTRAAAQKTTRTSAAANVLSVVKPSKAGAKPGQLQVPLGGRFVASGVTVRDLIAASYGGYIPLRPEQITGGPKWIDSERFDIEARADTPDEGDSPFDEIDSDADFVGAFAIVRTLLTDRFKLVVHEKTTDGRLYALTSSRQDRSLGPQLQKSTIDCDAIAAKGPFAPRPTGRDERPQGPCGPGSSRGS